MSRYEEAKKKFAALGVDTDAAMEKLKNASVSVHCWQGDDVIGFDHEGPLTGGIQTTGNYPGKATTPQQLMDDIDKAMSLCPAKRNSIFTRAMRYLRTASLLTVISSNPNTLQSGLSLQKKEVWVSTLTRHSFHTIRLKTA